MMVIMQINPEEPSLFLHTLITRTSTDSGASMLERERAAFAEKQPFGFLHASQHQKIGPKMPRYLSSAIIPPTD